MKFSGHETFPLREGWLHKGLALLINEPQKFLEKEVADTLGVGRNMAKSIRYWLISTGLAENNQGHQKEHEVPLIPTQLGTLIWEKDCYFLEKGTWWILHANLVNNFEGNTTWSWFFNQFNHDRFDRAVCLESLRRFIQSLQKRCPGTPTLNRDLGCMLLSYARSIPATNDDPEDGADCPFRELDLLNYYRESGYYQSNHSIKPIPPAVFGYVMSLSFSDLSCSGKSFDVKLTDATRNPGSPGRVFCLNGETLFETVSRVEADAENLINISGMAGDRTVRVRAMPSIEWAAQFFESIDEVVCA